MEIEVFAIEPLRYLGMADSFGAAKRMQQDALPEDLQRAYAGIEGGMPLFYEHLLTDDLRTKYPALAKDEA